MTRGRSLAREKSAEREGSLGCVRVDEVVSVGLPRNWDARSSYCTFRLCSVSERVREALDLMSGWVCEEKRMLPTMYLLHSLTVSFHL